MQPTLEQVIGRLYAVHHDLTAAQIALARARDKEVNARETLTLAVAQATMSAECPRPRRGDNGITVADRDAWVDQETATARFAAAVAEVTRKAAEDHLRVVRDQASLVQSMSAAMRAEMALTQTPL